MSARILQFPSDPVAATYDQMCTSKQLFIIRDLARDLDLDIDAECRARLKCYPGELNRQAASAFITHLQTMRRLQLSQQQDR